MDEKSIEAREAKQREIRQSIKRFTLHIKESEEAIRNIRENCEHGDYREYSVGTLIELSCRDCGKTWIEKR